VDIKIFTENGTYKVSDNETVDAWFASNAHKYGFINSDPNGEYGHGSDERVASTQFRYVGIAHATYIAAKGLDLEAYVELIKSNHKHSDDHLKIEGADGSSYEVYYVASAGETTNVPIPENYQYTVSGDNIGGFIVTVNLSKPVK
jgi:D-alanyl-D-alanine carboxypeptidase